MSETLIRKTLVIKKGTKYQEFLHYDHDIRDWVTCSTPELYPETVTMELIKDFHSSYDFDGVDLVELEIKIK